MNRSLLLVICDFLLLSLLALARFDEPEPEAPQPEMTAEERAATDAAVDRDLVEILKLSLDAEKSGTEELSQTLEQTQEALAAREKALAERSARLSEVEMSAAELAAQKAELEKARAEAEAEKARLATLAETTQKELREADAERVSLAKNLAEAKETSASSAERMKAMQDAMQRQEALLKTLQDERQQLESSRRIAEDEARALQSRLAVAQMETKVIASNLETARADIEVTRQEKKAILETTDKLAEGVGTLAASTEGIAKEVKELRPLSLNALFDRYRQNRVRISFEAETRNFLGTSQHSTRADTLLVSDGTRTFALLHVEETPLSRSSLQSVKARLDMGGKAYNITQVGFLASDPRVVAVAVPTELAKQLNVQSFTLAKDPLRYPEAVIIDSSDNAYAESPFKLDTNDPRYVVFKNDLFTRVFGEFSPAPGDLILAKTGDYLGLMLTSRMALVPASLDVSTTLSLGDRFSQSKADEIRVMVENAQRR